MNVTGIIVEYNPLHNGHEYHLQRTKEITGADLLVAVMSGNFLQRGEPAIVSKWTRTKMALFAGVDIVVELPYLFATGKADIFAAGAVSILTALQVDAVCFGSEDGRIEPFLRTVQFIDKHKSRYQSYIKQYAAKGYSFPKAAALAFSALKPDEEVVDLSRPNNILGYHYVRAIAEQKSPIKPFTIQRFAADYHENTMRHGNIASATSLRKTVMERGEPLQTIAPYVPPATLQLLQKSVEREGLVDWERLFPYLQYKIATTSAEELQQIYEMEEGIEHRVQKKLRQAKDFEQLAQQVKTKRYTRTRLQRIFVHTLTNTKKEAALRFLRQPRAPYIRLLGMNQKGRAYLNEKKKTLSVPLVSTPSRYFHPMLEMDVRAAQCHTFGYRAAWRKKCWEAEYATPPIIVD